jgi:selenocysteine-specific elongation factor
MRVLGTAGHVDHGKSALVEALSGIHPDRLAEEKLREMTIDLGFAWFQLPNGEDIGVVDVPGHRDFIENMLAGVGGIDAAILVVAADEGIMPQTREHLSILHLLQIPTGVVALTKIDLVDDSDWLELVEEDIRAITQGTILEGSPIVRVSSKTKEGIDELKNVLQDILKEKPPRLDKNRPRLPIDRVFSIPGFGTVVTGTLSDGTLRVGEEVEVLPKRIKARIRGLQSHKKKEEVAVPGSRTAINLSGVSVDQIRRGDVVAHIGDYSPTRRVDVSFTMLKDAQLPLRHNSEVKLFLWTSEVMARARVLGAEELLPGEEGWLQLELVDEIIALRGDRFILRRPSPSETLGGGMILDAFPIKRHRRFSSEVLEGMKRLTLLDNREALLQTIQSLRVTSVEELLSRVNIKREEAEPLLRELVEENIIIEVGRTSSDVSSIPQDVILTTKTNWIQLNENLLQIIEKYHQMYPLRRGVSKEELKSRLKTLPKVFQSLVDSLVSEQEIIDSGKVVWRKGFSVQLNGQQEKRYSELMRLFAENPYSPPSVKECIAYLGEEEYLAVIDQGRLIQVAEEVVFRREDYEKMVGGVEALIRENGSVTAAQVRDFFHTSRKYALALLEHLDAIGITVREGDVRRLKR